MRKGVWALLAAAAVMAEADALRHHHNDATLSHVTRAVFQTDDTTGRVAFVLGWLSLTAWFLPHILRTNQNGTPRT